MPQWGLHRNEQKPGDSLKGQRMREKEGKLKIKMPDKQEGFKVAMRYRSTWARMVKIPKKDQVLRGWNIRKFVSFPMVMKNSAYLLKDNKAISYKTKYPPTMSVKTHAPLYLLKSFENLYP